MGRIPVNAGYVLITEELGRRPPRTSDYAAENRALDALAREMAARPEAVLQKLADVVVELCQADSAGISILEATDDTEVFRWRAVAGRLAAYRGGVVPRDRSPCGIVFDRDTALLFQSVEKRHFSGVERHRRANLRDIAGAVLPEWRVDRNGLGDGPFPGSPVRRRGCAAAERSDILRFGGLPDGDRAGRCGSRPAGAGAPG